VPATFAASPTKTAPSSPLVVSSPDARLRSPPSISSVTSPAQPARPTQAAGYRQHLEQHLLTTAAARGELFRNRLATWRGVVEQDFFGSPLLLFGTKR
jgi:hypothetical protein